MSNDDDYTRPMQLQPVTPGAPSAAVLAPPPKHILVNGHRIHLRLVQTIAWLGIAGFVAVLVISGAYYGITQNALKHGWDFLFTQAWWAGGQDRHLVRALIEGIFALPLLKWVASSWKKHYDDQVISGWEIAARLIGFIVAALALMIAVIWFVTFGYEMITHHTATGWHPTTHVHWLMLSPRAAEAIAFAAGLVIGQATHWIWKPAARDIQLYFAEALVSFWVRWGPIPLLVREPLLPPSLRERVAWMHDEGVPCPERGRWFRIGGPVITVVFLGLLGTGIYARYFA